mmetsp:Transcript_86941/g.106626  ORF Transcript_86941/g.106626 Transcript_86941/m.106626 type:complete len:332 (-) Transcript_86941:82-1077(-)
MASVKAVLGLVFVTCIITTESFRGGFGIKRIIRNAIGDAIDDATDVFGCSAVDILKINSLFARFMDAQSQASKFRLIGDTPDPNVINEYIAFVEQNVVPNFLFNFSYIDRNRASVPVEFFPGVPNPVIYPSRDLYLYSNFAVIPPQLSWIDFLDLFGGIQNLNGGNYGYLNCDDDGFTLVTRTIDFLAGDRFVNPNIDAQMNGLIDNSIGLARITTKYNKNMSLTATFVEAELFGTVEFNTNQDPTFAKSNNHENVNAKEQTMNKSNNNNNILGANLTNYLILFLCIVGVINLFVSLKWNTKKKSKNSGYNQINNLSTSQSESEIGMSDQI